MKYKVTKAKIYSFCSQVRCLENKCKRRSFESQRTLHQIINDIFFKILKPTYHIKFIRNLKQKHVDYIVNVWKSREYGQKTLVNKLSILRKILYAADKHALVRKNSYYGIQNPKIEYQDKRLNENDYMKDYLDISKVEDKNVRRALYLQRSFGLRMREASLLKTYESIERDEKGKIYAIQIVRGSKNGRYRKIPVKTNTQRKLLEFIEKEYKGKNVIPKEINFKQWRDHFYYICRKSKITTDEGSKPHGLRQSYAQERFDRIMKKLVDESIENKKEIKIESYKTIAGSIVSRELGHNRLGILIHYIEGWNDRNFLKLKYLEDLSLV